MTLSVRVLSLLVMVPVSAACRSDESRDDVSVAADGGVIGDAADASRRSDADAVDEGDADVGQDRRDADYDDRPACVQGPIRPTIAVGGGYNIDVHDAATATLTATGFVELVFADGRRLPIYLTGIPSFSMPLGTPIDARVIEDGPFWLETFIELRSRDRTELIGAFWRRSLGRDIPLDGFEIRYSDDGCVMDDLCGPTTTDSLNIALIGRASTRVAPGTEANFGAYRVGNGQSGHLLEPPRCTDTPQGFISGYVLPR